MSVKRDWGLRAGVSLAVLSGVWCGPVAAQAAAPCVGEAAMELRVTATALAPELDRTLLVRVFDDGCVQLHKPAYRRDGGDFRLDLDAAALAALRRRVDQPALRSFDAKRVNADIAAEQLKRKTDDGRMTRLSELDADIHELRWRSGSQRSTAAWTGLPGDAKAYPDNVTLQLFHNAATALQALADRSDAARTAGGRP